MKENIIYGKTVDGRDIALDGFRVESFTSLRQTSTEVIVEVVFKSGQTIQVLSVEDEKGDSLWSNLVYVSSWLKPPIPTPQARLTDFTKVDGSYGLFDSKTVEFLISWGNKTWIGGPSDPQIDGPEYVELHFASGKTFTIIADSLEEKQDLRSDLLDNVVEDFIYRMRKKSK